MSFYNCGNYIYFDKFDKKHNNILWQSENHLSSQIAKQTKLAQYEVSFSNIR